MKDGMFYLCNFIPTNDMYEKYVSGGLPLMMYIVSDVQEVQVSMD